MLLLEQQYAIRKFNTSLIECSFHLKVIVIRSISGILLGSGKNSLRTPKAPYEGVTPLCAAAENGHAEVVRIMLGHSKTDVNKAPERSGTTPLYMATQNGHLTVVEQELILLKTYSHDIQRIYFVASLRNRVCKCKKVKINFI